METSREIYLSREIHLRWKTYNQVFSVYSLWPEDQGKPKLFLMYDKVWEAKTQFFSFFLFISLCQGLSVCVCVCVYLYVCMCIKSRFYIKDSWIGLLICRLFHLPAFPELHQRYLPTSFVKIFIEV